ncbi:MAG: DUF4336 domain-containing protein [Deltaproteobacteria bacterium]|nr:DUF4336 domain-containing protein [Deltaproteobacteria bacterium]
MTIDLPTTDNTGLTERRRIDWAEGVALWEVPLRFYGVPFGTRMTVVRLASGDLWVHSPIALDDALREEVDALGTVRFVVSPNKIHHLFMGDWQARYPDARLYASPGLAKKRSDLAFHADLGDEPPTEWAEEIDQCVLRGSSVMQEVCFFHRASRTLIIADMMEYFGPHSTPWLTRLVARLAFYYDRPAIPPDWRLTFRDREALGASVARLEAWDFDRVILAHGKLIVEGGKEMWRKSYHWAGA